MLKQKANQTLIGTALNILSTALAVVLIKQVTKTDALPVGNSRLNFTRFYEIFNVNLFGVQGDRFNWLIIIVLVFTSRKNVGPKALGEPYDKGKR